MESNIPGMICRLIICGRGIRKDLLKLAIKFFTVKLNRVYLFFV